VKSWLVQKGGVNGKQIKTKGWGKANPVAPNTNPDGSDNPDGRQKNRRVEITVKK
jgi:outer membrane protein OmpA-like peptidoglycan-associated protein